MADSSADQELADRYRRYNALCNAHDFSRLGEFVAQDIRVNDEPTGLAAYAAGLSEVVAAWRDGLITEVWVASDRLAALDQLRR